MFGVIGFRKYVKLITKVAAEREIVVDKLLYYRRGFLKGRNHFYITFIQQTIV